MGLSYRTDEELQEWQKRDPIHLFEAQLAQAGVLDQAGAAAVHDAVSADVKAGIEFAEASPLPDASTLLDDVYA